MSDLISRSDVIETANKFSFTDENDRRKYLDFLDYCLKETKTAYNVDKVIEQLQEKVREAEEAADRQTSFDYKMMDYCTAQAFSEAVEILKDGGIK